MDYISVWKPYIECTIYSSEIADCCIYECNITYHIHSIKLECNQTYVIIIVIYREVEREKYTEMYMCICLYVSPNMEMIHYELFRISCSAVAGILYSWQLFCSINMVNNEESAKKMESSPYEQVFAKWIKTQKSMLYLVCWLNFHRALYCRMTGVCWLHRSWVTSKLGHWLLFV